jgi:hypothetical protein
MSNKVLKSWSFLLWGISFGLFLLFSSRPASSAYMGYIVLAGAGFFIAGWVFYFLEKRAAIVARLTSTSSSVLRGSESTKSQLEKSSHKRRVSPLLTAAVFIIVALFLIAGKDEVIKEIKRQQLINFYAELIDAITVKNYEFQYYQQSPELQRTVSLNDFVAIQQKADDGVVSRIFVPRSYTVDGDRGIINRTQVVCLSQSCSGSDRIENTIDKEYVYINGKWYAPKDNNILCNRKDPYPLAPEFERALSLILQRTQEKTPVVYDDIKAIRKCLTISYTSDANIKGAEGVFQFQPQGTKDKLEILVSNRYSEKDDILTAILLSHELAHAYRFSTGLDKQDTCYENEATAFYAQDSFTRTLNKEEIDSLISRYINKPSNEIRAAIERPITFYLKNKVVPTYDDFLNMVKNDPFYRQECSK